LVEEDLIFLPDSVPVPFFSELVPARMFDKPSPTLSLKEPFPVDFLAVSLKAHPSFLKAW